MTIDTGGRETVLRLSGITKRFGSLVANDGISFDLKQGEVLGLLGENGAGKTTLMNILFGHYVADEGSIELFGQPLPPGEPRAALRGGIGMVHQHFTLADNLTVLDNIMLGTEPMFSLRSRLGAARERVVSLSREFGLAVNPDVIVSGLSVGERQRVEILKALYRDARILILDEPTAVLTPQEATGLFETLKRFVAKGLSIIFISHKLGEMLDACQRVVVLRGGRKVAEQSVAGATRADLAGLMVGRSVAMPKATPQPAGQVTLDIADAVARRGSQQLQGVSLTVRAGEVVGVAGVAGNGQSLLFDLVAGTLRLTSGRMSLGGETLEGTSARDMVARGVARIPEDRLAEGMFANMDIRENVIAERLYQNQFASRGLINWREARRFAEGIIKAYSVKCAGVWQRVGLLSGGNIQKLILGRVMAGEPKLVLANQPTRGLDVGAVAYVHEQLLAARARGAAVLLISDDLDELFALSDMIAVMYRGRLSTPVARHAITIETLGLMMAGQGFDSGADAHAA